MKNLIMAYGTKTPDPVNPLDPSLTPHNNACVCGM